MMNLNKRLKKLEAQLTDRSCLSPLSPDWMAYWGDRLARLINDEQIGEPSHVPLQYVDAILADAEQERA